MSIKNCFKVKVLECESQVDSCKLIGSCRYVQIEHIFDNKKIEDVILLNLHWIHKILSI